MFEEIDADILAMPLPKLQRLYQQRREEARKAMQTLAAAGNDNCWDDMVKAIESLLPPEDRKLFKLGHFNMGSSEILGFCKKWIAHQRQLGNVLPDKKRALE